MSNYLISDNIVLFGVGKMGLAYAPVLRDLRVNYSVVGRSREGVERFYSILGIKAIPGSFEGWRDKKAKKIDTAIVAVNEEELAQLTIKLMEYGVKRILLEKPGGCNTDEIKLVNDKARQTGTEIYVAYNRRFYSSVLRAQEIIHDDGGVKSFHFDFTEIAHSIPKVIKNRKVLENWFFINPIHVIDMAFFLGGKPKQLKTYTYGTLDWHPEAAVFSGSGITENNALFSYHANWLGPGRWGLEVITNKHRLIFQPLEKLKVQKRDSFDIINVCIADKLDVEFKPGIYLQTKLFLEGIEHPNFIKIDEHYENIDKYYNLIISPSCK